MREDLETADFRNVTRDRILREEISTFEQELWNERKRGTYRIISRQRLVPTSVLTDSDFLDVILVAKRR